MRCILKSCCKLKITLARSIRSSFFSGNHNLICIFPKATKMMMSTFPKMTLPEKKIYIFSNAFSLSTNQSFTARASFELLLKKGTFINHVDKSCLLWGCFKDAKNALVWFRNALGIHTYLHCRCWKTLFQTMPMTCPFSTHVYHMYLTNCVFTSCMLTVYDLFFV